jgi:hypothetical protein
VLGVVKDATRRCRGGLRPSLTAPARAALRGAGRDEGMGRPVERRDAQEEASLPHYHRVRALDLTTVLNASSRRPVGSAATWPTFTSVQWPASNRKTWPASSESAITYGVRHSPAYLRKRPARTRARSSSGTSRVSFCTLGVTG